MRAYKVDGYIEARAWDNSRMHVSPHIGPCLLRALSQATSSIVGRLARRPSRLTSLADVLPHIVVTACILSLQPSLVLWAADTLEVLSFVEPVSSRVRSTTRRRE